MVRVGSKESKGEQREPWEQQPWDTPASYRAFHDFYLALQRPRSVNEAYRRHLIDKGKEPPPSKRASGTWQHWSRGCKAGGEPIDGALSWQERAAAYDVEQDARIRAELEARRLQARLETAELGKLLRQKAMNAARLLVAVSQTFVDENSQLVPAAHHRLWLQLLCDEGVKKLLIIAPPESAKTTWAISAYVGCFIGVFPERSVIIGSASGPIAEKRSLALRALVETEAWRETFPGVGRAAGLKWETTEWSLAPDGVPRRGRLHSTVSAYGTGGAIIGSRADVVVADNLLDFENSRTTHQRSLVEQWLHNSLLSRLKSRVGRAIVIGTAWHHEDIYMKAMREGGWIVCHIPLLSESDQVYATLIYPDGWSGPMLGQPSASAEIERRSRGGVAIGV